MFFVTCHLVIINQITQQLFHILSPSAQSLPCTPLWAVMVSIRSQTSTRCCRTTWSLSLNPNSLAPSNTSREFWRLRMEVGISLCGCVSVNAGGEKQHAVLLHPTFQCHFSQEREEYRNPYLESKAGIQKYFINIFSSYSQTIKVQISYH